MINIQQIYKDQKGFSAIETTILLVIIALVVGAGFMLIGRSSTSDKTKNTSNTASSESSMPTCTYKGYQATAPRKDAVNAVTYGPTDVKYIKYILNHTSDDKRFVYMVNNTEADIPVYAPADGRLVYVINKHADNWNLNGGRPADYDVTFTVDCKSFWRINHIVDPIESIKNAEPNENVIELEAGKGLQDEWGQPKAEVVVRAGQQIGTTRVPSQTQWDIGYFKDGEAVCIFNELTTSKEAWLNLISPEMGMNAKPVSGTRCTGQTGGI